MFGEELSDAYVSYMELIIDETKENGDVLAPIFYGKLYIHIGFAKRSLCSPEFLLNISRFPIGIAYGDRDYLGSEGADWIIKSNAFFKTGEA